MPYTLWLPLFYDHLTNPKKMEPIHLPEFLNTEEKWCKLVQSTTSVDQFEEIFHKLLEDESVPTLDVLRIMRKLERDIYMVHGNKDIYCVMDVVDSIVQYMITSTREFEVKAEETQEEQETKSEQKCEEVSTVKTSEKEGSVSQELKNEEKESEINEEEPERKPFYIDISE